MDKLTGKRTVTLNMREGESYVQKVIGFVLEDRTLRPMRKILSFGGLELKLKIYIASSWKNAKGVRVLAELLAKEGMEVYDFTDETKHFSFNLNMMPNHSEMDYMDVLMYVPESLKAFKVDRGGLDWANVVIMLLPCGRSSHLEFGYGVGKGHICMIYGDLPLGEYEVMYHFADNVFHKNDVESMIEHLKKIGDW